MFYKNLLKKPLSLQGEYPTKLLIGILTCGAIIFITYIGKIPYGSQPQVGKISDRTIYAPFDFTYDMGIDVEKTEETKKTAALNTKDVYDITGGVYEEAARKIKTLFALVKESAEREDLSDDEKINYIKNNLKNTLEISDNSVGVLLQSPEAEKTDVFVLEKMRKLLSGGIMSPDEKEDLAKQDKISITIRNTSAKTESDVEIKNIKTSDDIKSHITALMETSTVTDKKARGVITEIISGFITPNLKSNVIETSSRREKAISDVPPQKKVMDVKKDELIIQRGERYLPFHVAKLETIRSASMEQHGFPFSIMGISFVVVTLVVILATYFAFYEPTIYSNNNHLFLISSILIALTAITKAVALSKTAVYFIPAAIGPMVIALLLGARPAIIIAIICSFLSGLILGGKFDSTLVFLAGSIIGIYAVRNVRKRSHLFKAGMLVGCTHAICIVGLGILNNLDSETIFNDSLWFFVNGLAVGAIITGILHIFEFFSQVTTNITLLELADPNNPLLKELILKAPGTYHHSLIVGNLAEAACDAINANGLLARVGAYYHDIGKVEKSEYFAENQPVSESQHDKLEPTMSSLIIINHVKEGLEKARKAKLNKILLDFIGQHHGTGLIYYFYQRALESVEDLEKLGEERFRYPGPKPQTKETAIVHLADSVEAASRTLANPTPTNLEELVRRIINNKFIDEQLDECDLTLKDLNIIATIFTKVLTGVYHTRVQYP